jgi:hypothetical protein
MRSRANQSTSRGEYAIALNCTITKAIAKTIPVSAIIPDAAAESRAWAEATERARL